MNIVKTNFEYRDELMPLDANRINYIIVHHTATQTETPEQIHQSHLEKGWSGFGYNEYIRKDGTVYIGRGDNVSAQCIGHNTDGYGICCEGDFTKDALTVNQKNSLVERIRYNKSRFQNLKKIVGHNELYATECPGKNIVIESIIKEVNKCDEKEHWALKHWKSLNAKGISILEQRLDDKVSRGELFKLLDEIVKGV